MRNRLNSFVLFFFFFFKKVSVIFHREKSISFNNVTRSSMIIDRVIPFRPNSPMTPVNQTRIEYQSTNRKGLKPSSRLQFQLDVRAPHVDRIVANNDAHLYARLCTDIYVSMYHYAGCALSVDRILKSDTRNREFVEYIARLLRDLSLLIDFFFLSILSKSLLSFLERK